jgi:multiple sugar transport system ATP-binding protein
MSSIALSNVNGLNLEVPDREFVVLAGPVGCGASATLRMIAGLDPVPNGDIFVGERRVNDLPSKDRDAAMVFPDYAPYPRMSVGQNLAFALKLRKFSETEIKKRVAGAAEMLGLQEILTHQPESLSAEQRQRLAVARAVARHPKVFLFHEPFSGLEAEARFQMWDEVRKLHLRGQGTVIYATHDPAEAMALGDRLVILNKGAIEQDGSALALYDEPANLFVAGFLGTPPMNLIQGTLKQDRDSLVFRESDDGTIELRLPASTFPGATGMAGQAVVLGIRPEDIDVVESSQSAEKRDFRALLESLEQNGAEAVLHLQTGANKLVSRTRRRLDHGEAGHRLRFEINPARAHLFDPISTLRISREG